MKNEMTEKEFGQKWIEKIRNELKSFPEDFVGSYDFEEVPLPGKVLFLNPPFFGSYQITDETGNIIVTTDNHFKAKYVLYANRSRPSQLKIPHEELHVYEAVRDYEKYLDTILKEMEKEFKQFFPNSKGFKRTSIQIFNSLNLMRQ